MANKKFRALDEDDDDEDDKGMRYVRAVDSWVCDAGANQKSDKTSSARLGVGEIVVGSAAEAFCWPKKPGDAFSIKPSKKNIT